MLCSPKGVLPCWVQGAAHSPFCRVTSQLWSSRNVRAGVQRPGGAHTPCQVPMVQECACRYLRECCWAGLQQQINLFAVTSLLFLSLKHLWVAIQPPLKEPGHSWLATKLKIKNSFSRWAQLCVHSALPPHTALLILTPQVLPARGLTLGVPSSSSQEQDHSALGKFCVLQLLFSFHCTNFSLAINGCRASFLIFTLICSFSAFCQPLI